MEQTNMNEALIQKIVNQCVDQRERHGTTVEVLQSRKFAELIVKECARVAMINTPDTEECEYTHLVSEAIKKHFGIED